MKLRHKILTAIFLIPVFLILPVFGTGAMWIRHVGLLPSTAVVFSDDAAAMDRFMASALKPYYGDRVGICDGVNDHVEIQAALDAVRDVKLSPGQFNCEVTIDIDNSNQTLRGCGRNTILTTSTADLVFLSAVGGDSSELTGIVIADLQIDGGAGAVSDCGIYFEYVDYSFIQNVYLRRHNAEENGATYLSGIFLYLSNYNQIMNSICQGNKCGIFLSSSEDNIISGSVCNENETGITLEDSHSNTISKCVLLINSSYGIIITSSHLNTIADNICSGTVNDAGIDLDSSNYNAIVGNTCSGNGGSGIGGTGDHNTISTNICDSNYRGIGILGSSYNIIDGNTSTRNKRSGIDLQSSQHNIISDNACIANSQDGDDTYDDIYLTSSDYNNIQGNTCRAGALANKPRYGINISNDTCDGNLVTNNDIHDDGFGTGSLNDVGTGTVTVAGNRV